MASYGPSLSLMGFSYLSSSPTYQTIIGYGTGLFFLLTSLFFLTFRGFPLSQDGYFIFDSTESLVRRGNFYRTYEYSKFNTVIEGIPWGEPLQEPLTSVLMAPFFWVGQNLSNLGTVHVTMLFNIVVTALTGVSLYAGSLSLGYSLRTAFMVALLYGMTTLAWVYSRHLFREPLMAIFIFWCVVSTIKLQHSWQRGRFAWAWALLAILAFACAFLTKAISIALLPGLFILLLPSMNLFRANRHLIYTFAGVVLVFIVFILIVLSVDTVRERYSIDFWLRELQRLELSFVVESFLGYQMSFSRSIWLHSPILVSGFFGAWILYKRGEWRQVVGVLMIIIVLSSSYAIAHQVSWWGSWGWGPRYMLPLIPILMLWILPLIERGLTGWYKVSFWILAGFGFGFQLLGMSVPLPNYYTDLNQAGLLTDFTTEAQWGVYNWTWRWSPLKYHLDRLNFRDLDFAWNYVDGGWAAPALALIMMILSIGSLLWISRRRLNWVMLTILSFGLASANTAGIVMGLNALRVDERYIIEDSDVYELVQRLDPAIRGDAIVFIDRDLYLPIFLNYFKSPVLTAILPYSPGENYGPPGPQITTDHIEEQIGKKGFYALAWSAQHYKDIWLVASSGPFETDKLRPIERYLATTHFPVEAIEVSSRTRAIRYTTLQIPLAQQNVDLLFGEQLLLQRVDLPTREHFAPGDVVPVILNWQPTGEIPDDYNVSVQIASFDGFPIAQRDGQPQGTFGKFSQWQPGAHYPDHHGILLPEDIAPGEYVLQVVVYRWQDGQRLTVKGGDIARIGTVTIGE